MVAAQMKEVSGGLVENGAMDVPASSGDLGLSQC